jgi:hypothetical protein
VDFFVIDPEAGRAVLAQVLREQGFEVATVPATGAWLVRRGSSLATAALGAMAGRKQRLEYRVEFFTHEGRLVARFRRDGGAGAMGGAIGVRRSARVFDEVAAVLSDRLTAAGQLANLVRS